MFQSVSVGLLVVVALAVTGALAAYGPKIGAGVADYLICRLTSADKSGMALRDVGAGVETTKDHRPIRYSALHDMSGEYAFPGQGSCNVPGSDGTPADPPTGPDQNEEWTFTLGEITGANPHLYVNINDLNIYQVTTNDPGAGWFDVGQFCGYMATYWLTHGHSANGLNFTDLSEQEQRDAVRTVRGWGDLGGGLCAQDAYAMEQLGGVSATRSQVQNAVRKGEYEVGTRIWFADSRHVWAAVLLENGRYQVYDPDTGQTQTFAKTSFASYLRNKDTFVVAPPA